MKQRLAIPINHKPPRENQHLLTSSTSTAADDMKLRDWLTQISVPVYVLVMFFAISSWIDINGLWVELPLMVGVLPEGWNLPSYLVVIIQVANIGPLTYTIARKLWPKHVKEWPVVYLIIGIGCVACILLANFWDDTAYIFGAERSVPLIVLSLFLSLVDCTSSVVFLPYMAIFKPQYMSAFYIGEGLSGFIPGIVGFIQGAGSNPKCVNQTREIINETSGINYTEWELVDEYSPPRFGVDAFFYFLFAMLCVSAISFTFLHFSSFCQKEKIENEERQQQLKENMSYEKPVLDSSSDNIMMEIEQPGEKNYGSTVDLNGDNIKPGLSTYQFGLLLGLTAWVNGLTNGVLPSTGSYSSLPYSNLAYTLSVRLSSVVNPLVCFLALFVSTKSLVKVCGLTIVATGLAAYQLFLAAQSPNPPMVDEFWGEFLLVSTSVLMSCFFSYVKVLIASIFRDEGARALFWCGAFQQVGSFVGAIITFVLVNIVEIFTAGDSSACTDYEQYAGPVM